MGTTRLATDPAADLGSDPRLAAYLASTPPPANVGVDAHGRALPRRDDPAAREAAAAAILALGEGPEDEDPDAVDRALRALDEGRPHRPLFGGMP